MVDKEQGWLSARLEELLIHVIGGDWGKGDDYVDDYFETVSCIRGSEFKNWKTELGATAVTRRIKSSSLATRQLVDGDLLIEISGGGPDQPVGRTVLITDQVLGRLSYPAVCTNFLRLARPSNYFNSAFLNNYLAKFYNSGEVVNYQGGSNNLRNLKFKEYSKIEIPIPPLAEQKVIADKLDTLLAQVEATKARLERITEILKTFRQSVLAAAVSGKLTEDWRLGNGLGKKQFAEAIELTEFRGRKLAALPSSWQWLRFNQVAEIASNLVSPVDNPDAIHIAPNHIDSWTGSVSNFQTIFDDGVTSAKHRFTKGQIIYSKIRPYLAKVAIAEFDGLCSADMYPINSRVNTKFLFRWMLTSEFTDWASNAESRSVLPKINQKDLNKIPVPTPPIKEQAEIVKRIGDLFNFAESIEQKANAALDRVNNLTQTILAKAFRGALTADWRAANHELITGENSVEALLEKIKAEREAIKPKKKAAPRKKA